MVQRLPRVTAATVDVLEAILQADAPTWGLRIVQRTGRPAGSVYPILERLESLGWVESAWERATERAGPRRRLYRVRPEAMHEASATVHAFRRRDAHARARLA